jgi:hypothetical protein
MHVSRLLRDALAKLEDQLEEPGVLRAGRAA